MAYIDDRRNQKLFGKKTEEKKPYYLPKKSVKKIAEEKEAKESGTDGAMDKWHEDGRLSMIGSCLFCGGRTEKDNNQTYRHSNAHLFAKRKICFPSIKLHPENRIELCYYENCCHTNFDQNVITFEDIKNEYPKAWLEIVRKTSILYQVMTEEEKNKVPQILIAAIKTTA